MVDRLNRFRQLEKPRGRGPEAPERTSTSGRIDAVLGPGEKAPAVAPPAPAASPGEEPDGHAAAGGPASNQAPPISPEILATMKGNHAELESLLMRELDRQPMHAGRQISLWRALMRRSVDELEGMPSHPTSIAFGVAAVLVAFSFGSCVVTGPRLWHLFAVAAIVFFLLRGRHHP